VAWRNVHDPMRRPFRRDRQFKDRRHDAWRRKQRRRNGDERVQEDGSIRAGVVEDWRFRCVAGVTVSGPVRVHGPAVVVLGRLIAGMGVQERSAQGRSLKGERERNRQCLPHDAFIVRDPAHGVKGAALALLDNVRPGFHAEADRHSKKRISNPDLELSCNGRYY
jgi:hypothetical protein